jgi:hypothetical protein
MLGKQDVIPAGLARKAKMKSENLYVFGRNMVRYQAWKFIPALKSL